MDASACFFRGATSGFCLSGTTPLVSCPGVLSVEHLSIYLSDSVLRRQRGWLADCLSDWLAFSAAETTVSQIFRKETVLQMRTPRFPTRTIKKKRDLHKLRASRNSAGNTATATYNARGTSPCCVMKRMNRQPGAIIELTQAAPSFSTKTNHTQASARGRLGV